MNFKDGIRDKNSMAGSGISYALINNHDAEYYES